MAKLADALASGASGRKVVQVQVLFRAQRERNPAHVFGGTNGFGSLIGELTWVPAGCISF